MLTDECEPVSDSSVDLSRNFRYLALTSSLGTVEIGRFLCLEVVVSRDGSAVKPDWVVAKPDEVELFAGKPGAKSIPMKALPGESCRLLGGDCRVPGRYCRFLVNTCAVTKEATREAIKQARRLKTKRAN